MTSPVAGEQLPEPIGDEYGVSVLAVSLLDQSRENYYTACSRFAKRPRPKTYLTVEEALEVYAEAFDHTVNALTTDGSLFEHCSTIARLHIEQDNSRANFLNGVLGKKVIEGATLDMEDDAAEETITDVERLTQMKTLVSTQIKALFRDGLIEDTNDFADEISESAPAKRFDRREAILKHALDIGKFGIGTALGIWVARLVKEPK